MELTIKIQDKDYNVLTTFLKTLNAEILSNDTSLSVAQEPMTPYGKKKRPSADEIEQMIIKKALLDAKAIERGELKTRSFNSVAELIAHLEDDSNDDDDDF